MRASDDDFKRSVLRYFEGDCAEWAVSALHAYCRGTDGAGQPLYTGQCFERFADRHRPDTFTTSDMVAVSMLSVNIPPRAAIRLVDGHEADTLLAAIGPDRPIWESELGDDDAADELWRALTDLEDVGPVTAGKLMAAKRPQLVPIYDQHVNAALRPPRRRFWRAMRRSMEEGHGAVSEVLAASDVGVTPLRAVDIVVWMHQHGWRYSGGAVVAPHPIG